MRGGRVPGNVGWLPEDPDDPPKLSWRQHLLVVAWVLLMVTLGVAIPDDWSFWETIVAYAAVGTAIGIALRLGMRWTTR